MARGGGTEKRLGTGFISSFMVNLIPESPDFLKEGNFCWIPSLEQNLGFIS